MSYLTTLHNRLAVTHFITPIEISIVFLLLGVFTRLLPIMRVLISTENLKVNNLWVCTGIQYNKYLLTITIGYTFVFIVACAIIIIIILNNINIQLIERKPVAETQKK